MESKISYSDPYTSAGMQIANYDMENKSTPQGAFDERFFEILEDVFELLFADGTGDELFKQLG